MNRADVLARGLLPGLLALLVLALPALARAADDPPGRVGRIAETDGRVSLYDDAQGAWVDAVVNRPLTTGDRVSTDGDGHATLRVGSTTLRLGSATELEVQRLDDQRVSLRLHAGSLALRIRAGEVAAETEIVTAEARLQPRRAGHYRVDRVDDVSAAGAWRGELDAELPGLMLTVDAGQRVELWREGGTPRYRWQPPGADAFGAWAQREDRADDERSAAYRHVSPEMTGAEDLDRYGRWDRHPDYGSVWVPMQVSRDWVPYRHGHWSWVRPWGWTWIDDAPWGFAPFHYGRWVHWGGRWAWYPGAYAPRPVWAPALVAWVGGSNFSVSIGAGGAPIGWVPLAPWEPFHPYYRATPVYFDRINPHRPRQPRPVRGQPVMYGNQGVPGAVTVVPRDVLVRRQPVSRGAIDVDVGRRPLRPVETGALPVAPPAPLRPQPPRADSGDDGRRGAPWPGRRPDSASPVRERDPGDDGRRPPRLPAAGDAAGGASPGAAPGRRPDAADGVDRRDAPGRGAWPGRGSERDDRPGGARDGVRDDGERRPAGPPVPVTPERGDPAPGGLREPGRMPRADVPERPPARPPRFGEPGGDGRAQPPFGESGAPRRPPPPSVERFGPDDGGKRPGREPSRMPVEPPAVQRVAPPPGPAPVAPAAPVGRVPAAPPVQQAPAANFPRAPVAPVTPAVPVPVPAQAQPAPAQRAMPAPRAADGQPAQPTRGEPRSGGPGARMLER